MFRCELDWKKVEQPEEGSNNYDVCYSVRLTQPGLDCVVKERGGIKTVKIDYKAGGISLKPSNSGSVHVGKSLGALEDMLNVELPEGERIRLKITAKGDVTGETAYSGDITSSDSNISLAIHSPLAVYTEAPRKVDTEGMIDSDDSIIHMPRGHRGIPSGVLELCAPKGSISVKYEPSNKR